MMVKVLKNFPIKKVKILILVFSKNWSLEGSFFNDGEGHIADREAGKIEVIASGLAQLLILDI